MRRDAAHSEEYVERLLAVVIETRGLIGAFEHELREIVGHTNVNCIKEKLDDVDRNYEVATDHDENSDHSDQDSV